MPKKMSGMEMFKLLPKTNCGECGVPTCMAFAMKLAQKSAELAACPYASDEAKKVIGEAAAPPIRLVRFGGGIACGNELVMFRHDKTFVHQTVFAYRIPSDAGGDELVKRSRKAEEYCLERVGEKLRIEAALIDDCSIDANAYRAAVETVSRNFKGGLILKSAAVDRLTAAAEAVAARQPLLYGMTADNFPRLVDFALAKKLPVVVIAPSIDALYRLASSCTARGLYDLVLDIPWTNSAALVQHNTIIRKSALGGIRELGFPIISTVPHRPSPFDRAADAASCICKYSSILVFDPFDDEVMLPLMMLRQNMYTDPQKPISVEPGIYPVGDAASHSPLLVTSNFSLTYFIVSGELESSGVGAHLAVVEAEGLSVLTAWAAGKFTGEKIAAFVKERQSEQKFSNRRIVIPGLVATISGELEEHLPGWEVLVGPQEASDIGPYMKRFL